jgi:hypothetical protein
VSDREAKDEDEAQAESNRADQQDPPAEREQEQAGGGGHRSGDATRQPAADEEVPLADLAKELPTEQRGGDSADRTQGAGEQDGTAETTGENGAPRAEMTRKDGAPPEEKTSEEGAPLEEMAGDVRKRRQRREQEPESDPFEEVDIGNVDGEAVWEELLTEEEMSEAERAVGAGVSATEVGSASAGERIEHIVPKDQFCSRCPYLGDPPGLACEHDGTEIVEVTDSERFRVRGCPFTGQEESDLADFE